MPYGFIPWSKHLFLKLSDTSGRSFDYDHWVASKRRQNSYCRAWRGPCRIGDPCDSFCRTCRSGKCTPACSFSPFASTIHPSYALSKPYFQDQYHELVGTVCLYLDEICVYGLEWAENFYEKDLFLSVVCHRIGRWR